MTDIELDNVDSVLNDGFNVLIEHLKQRFEYLKTFKITSHITDKEDKEKPEYKRGMDIADGLPKFVMEINKLRGELGVGEKPKEESSMRIVPVSPQSISKLPMAK